MPLDSRLVVIPNDAPPFWVLYAHSVLLRAVATGNETEIENWCTWAGGANFRFFPSSSSLLSNFCLITDGTVGIGVFADTRSVLQLAGQIVGSGMSEDTPRFYRASNFDQIYASAVMTEAAEVIPPTLQGAPVLITGHSLGGAIAEIFGCRKIDGNFTDVGLLTYGQPRTGDQSLADAAPARYCRVVNLNDPVPGIPPRTANIGGYYLFNQDYYDPRGYVHGGQAYLVTVNDISQTTDEETGTDLFSITESLLQGFVGPTGVETYHPLAVYSSMIYPHALLQGGGLDLGPVVEISRRIAGQPLPDPDPANAPIVPAIPPASVLAAPEFVPLPVPGSLPSQFSNQAVQLLNVPNIQIGNTSSTNILSGERDMANICKVTFFYQQLNQGWQEVYYNNASTIAACLPLAINLGNALMAFRGQNTALINFRISLQTVPLAFPRVRTVRLFPPQTGWGRGAFVVQRATTPPHNWSDFYSACVLMKGVPATFGQPQKSIFMRGLPDDYDVGGGQIASPLWSYFGMNLVQALQQALAPAGNPFGWLGTIQPADRTTVSSPISTFVQNPNGTVTITTSNPIPSLPAGALGNSNRVFPVRISTTVNTMKGTQAVWVDPTGTIFTTKKRIAIAPTVGPAGTLTYVPKTFIPFSGTIIRAPVAGNVTTFGNLFAERISERKAGKIFGTSPGRVRNHVRA